MMSVSRGVPCLKPNDWTVTCCLLEARYSKLGSIARRRSWIDRSEVSMTTSADSLRFATRARSRSMPTSRVPDPWSGWVRRRLSKRFNEDVVAGVHEEDEWFESFDVELGYDDVEAEGEVE